jgi:hypothetical protein
VGRGDAMTATGLVCSSCGIELPQNAKFCLECGAAVSTAAKPAEYKQVTVLFADVVHSMDIAAAVGAERLREIMTDLADRCAAVVKRYGGTVDKFTGDGIMAVFGAPIALEDHAIRACLAALGLQEEAKRLAVDVRERDGVDLQLRVGLNSGQVIAGEIGSGPFGYTTVGEQVGMAQRIGMRAIARYWLGRDGWRDDLQQGLAMARSADPRSYATVVTYVYFPGILFGVLEPDDCAVREIEDALRIAEQSSDDLALAFARATLGVALVHRQTAAECSGGLQLLAEASEAFLRRGHNHGRFTDCQCVPGT